MRVDHQLGQPQDFSAKMEGISEARLLSFFGCQSFDWLEIEVVVEMEIVQVFSMNQQVQHVVTLPANL